MSNQTQRNCLIRNIKPDRTVIPPKNNSQQHLCEAGFASEKFVYRLYANLKLYQYYSALYHTKY